MSSLNNISISFNTSPLFLIAGILVLVAYTYFIYRYTIPKLNSGFKYFLTSIRALSIAILFLLIFEPIINLDYIKEIKQIDAVFIDNSNSIAYEDSSSRIQQINAILDKLETSEENNFTFFSFGNHIIELNKDSLKFLRHDENSTNISEIFNYLKNNNLNLSSILLFSDGILTEGSSPVFPAEKLGVPINTIGIGNSSTRSDIELKKIVYNDIIYADKNTTFEISIVNTGFEGNRITASFFENNKIISEKIVELNGNGINKLFFNYKPESPGEKKISVRLSELQNEISNANNSSTVFINVLDNKLQVLTIAGSPSSDLSFILNSIKSSEYYNVETITQLNNNRYLENNLDLSKIDSADVILLVGFPSTETSSNLLAKIKSVIQNGKPYLLTLSAGINYQKLKSLSEYLPFSFSESSFGNIEVQPEIFFGGNSIFSNLSSELISEWNNLPPINQPKLGIKVRPESRVLIKTKFKGISTNTPLLLARSVGNSRAMALIGKDFWKWKLRPELSNSVIFDNFILNTVKWLSTDSNLKNVIIKPVKQYYNIGEKIEFQAQIYDELFNPMSDAEVEVIISNKANKFNLAMHSIGNGLYEGVLETSIPGDYNFIGKAIKNNSIIDTDEGKLSISDVEVERINLKMDEDLLKLLSQVSGGKYYNISEGNDYLENFDNFKKSPNLQKHELSEISLWSNEYFLIILIILFSIEWFFRKRSGML